MLPSATDVTGLQWGLRALLLALGLVMIGLLVVVPLLLIVKPVATEALRAREAGDWWLPFLPDAAGDYGPLASNHWWSVFRAESREGSLSWRWAFWAIAAVGLTFACSAIAWNTVTLLRRVWP